MTFFAEKNRTLLLELPFKSITRPNIGFSILRSILESKGVHCDIRYANIDFAELLGYDIYTNIAERIAHEYLIGDLVFASYVNERPTDFEELRSFQNLAGKQIILSEVPDWIWEKIESFQSNAIQFTRDLAASVVEGGYKVFGFNLMFQSMPNLAVAKAIKEIDSKIIVIFGGANCEGPMGLALHQSYEWIDYVCRGEGEYLISDLYDFLCSGSPQLESIPGLIWRDKVGSVVNGARSHSVKNMDEIPTPNYVDWIEQLGSSKFRHKTDELSIPFETSRGCWYGEKNHCIFCGLNGESLTFRYKSHHRVLKELQELLRHKIDNFYCVDLILPNSYFDTLLPELGKKDWPISIFFECKANLTRGQVELLKKAGVNQIQPGIENLNSTLLRLLKKGVHAYQNIRLLRWAAELGVTVEWNLLYGIPGERAEDYEQILDLLPLISHLRAPTVGCSKIRIDRFSPLEKYSEKFDLGRLWPSPAYNVVFDLPPSRIENIAYFFDSQRKLGLGVIEEVECLKVAVANWCRTRGDITFVSLHLGKDTLLLTDNRACAKVTSIELCGSDATIYDACDEGASLEQIATKVSIGTKRVRPVLNRFVENGWVIMVDNRYLSLATCLDEIVEIERFPRAFVGEIASSIQKRRMRSMWQTIDHYETTSEDDLDTQITPIAETTISDARLP